MRHTYLLGVLLIAFATAAVASAGSATATDEDEASACSIAQEAASQAANNNQIEELADPDNEGRQLGIQIYPCECSELADGRWSCTAGWDLI